MAEQRAVRFAHRLAPLLAFGVVGFLQRDRDGAVLMARHDLMRRVGHVVEELEEERLGGEPHVLRLREVEAEQGVEELMLGGLDLAPGQPVIGAAQLRDDAVVGTGRAHDVGRVGGDHPVADAMRGIGAETEAAVLEAERAKGVAIGFESGQDVVVRPIAERMLAALATSVFEEKYLGAMLAGEKLHRAVRSRGRQGRGNDENTSSRPVGS